MVVVVDGKRGAQARSKKHFVEEDERQGFWGAKQQHPLAFDNMAHQHEVSSMISAESNVGAMSMVCVFVMLPGSQRGSVGKTARIGRSNTTTL